MLRVAIDALRGVIELDQQAWLSTPVAEIPDFGNRFHPTWEVVAMTTIVHTAADVFNLPEGAVIRTATGSIGEVSGVLDAPAWVWVDNERIIPRYVAWSGSDIRSYLDDSDWSQMLPAEVIWTPPLG